LLTPIKDEQGAASLLFLLEDARNRMESQQREISTALQAAEALKNQEQYAEGIRFLESRPPQVLRCEPVQIALKRMRESNESELTTLRAVGTAYAALDRPDLGAGSLPSPGGDAESSLLTRIVPVFASRRKSVADRQLTLAIEQARMAIDAGDKKQAAKVLKDAAAFTEYADSNLQSEWQALNKKAEKGKLFGR